MIDDKKKFSDKFFSLEFILENIKEMRLLLVGSERRINRKIIIDCIKINFR